MLASRVPHPEDDMPFERLAKLEAEMQHIKEDINHIAAKQENTDLTLRDIAGLMRDQRTERKLMTKVVHVVGWAISAGLGYLASKYGH